MMEKKDCKTLSNSNLRLYKIELENYYESVKAKIKELVDTLDDLDKEYIKVEEEIRLRGNSLY